MAQKQKNTLTMKQAGFTIVELMVVIAVIGVLAAIAYVGYAGVQDRAREGVLRSDLTKAAEALGIDKARTGSFPASIGEADRGSGLSASKDTIYEYSVDNEANPPTFCLSGVNGKVEFFITDSTNPQEGICPGHSIGMGIGEEYNYG